MKKGILILLLLAGCASVGTNVNMATVDSLKPGMTQAEVISVVGRPNVRTRLADGSEQWIWSYGHANTFGSTKSNAVMVKFGPDGRYLGVMSQTQGEVR